MSTQEVSFNENMVFRITNKNLGDSKSLTITQDGGLLKDTKQSLTQAWMIVKQADGYYKLLCFQHANIKALTVDQYAGDIYSLQFANDSGASDQKWAIEQSDSGYYRLINQSQNEKSLSDDLNETSHDLAILSPTKNSDEQFWKITEFTPLVKFEAGKYYRLTNKLWGDSRSLEVSDDGVMMAETANEPGQYWKIINDGGLYKLSNTFQGETKVIDIVNDGSKDNRLKLVNSGNTAGEFWLINKADNGYYTLNNLWQNKYSLGCEGDDTYKQIADLLATDAVNAQYWMITEVNPDGN